MKFLDVNKHLSELDEHIKVLKSYGDVFEAVEARITRVINMDGAFKGEGAKGVIYNHAHMQLPTIRSIRAFLISFSDTLEKMKANITEYEPASNGSVSENFWKNQLPKAYDRYEETLEEREATINQATAQVSHILHLGKLQTGDLYNSVDSARKHADTVLEGLYDLDQAGVELMAQVRTKMEELKATIRQVLDWNMTGGVTMKGVSIMEIGGYFANNATLHEKAPEVSMKLSTPNPLVQYANNFPLRFKYDTMRSIMKRIKLANYQQWFARMLRGLLPLTTHYNVMRISAGKTVASQANASFGSTTNRYSILSTSLSDFDLEQYKQPLREQNAFDKSINSFKEIGLMYYEQYLSINQKKYDSLYDYINYELYGALDTLGAIYNDQKVRLNHSIDEPSLYNITNLISFGTTEMVDGAIKPNDPYSTEHWLNIIGTGSLVTGGAGAAASSGIRVGTSSGLRTGISSGARPLNSVQSTPVNNVTGVKTDSLNGQTIIAKEKSLNNQVINIDKIAPLLKTEPNTAFFWSGRTDGVGGTNQSARNSNNKRWNYIREFNRNQKHQNARVGF
ncbi:T7SS effector LXG polymorphic toxin [Halalkalibacterium halodurans]|uniref:ribonuclease YeeF family protein n=1 Tax=Halalkalibacterium halodurans TaxID=86665 RepID=UPI002E2407D3|nr:T7SS effector LXG polymorphic toxin [Halalkalibacterium halodurans]